jgi:hypothetical protein
MTPQPAGHRAAIENLPDGDAAALLVEQADIGEGTAGIDSNPPSHLSVPLVGDPLR